MAEKCILSSKKDGLGIIQLNRPSALNSLNHQMFYEMIEIMDEFENDPEVRAIVFTGTGEKAFCAGGDLNEELALDTLGAYQWVKLAHSLYSRIEAGKKPTIAAINGYCLGGGFELSLACDIRICAPHAKMGAPESNVGVICGFGGNLRLPRIVGSGRAKEMLMTGKMVDAEEAYRIGLVNHIAPEGELMSYTEQLCSQFTKKSAVVLEMIKTAVNYGSEMDMRSAIQFDCAMFAVACATEDRKEGMSAFLEKRKPEFKDR